MRLIFSLCSLLLGLVAMVSCKKTPEYVAVPYKCECGNLTWQGEEYPLLGTTYILTDSTNAKSRRYHITADVLPEGEAGPHGLSLWFELDDIGNGGSFVFGGGSFTAQADEYNPNDPTDTLRQYIPISGSMQIGAAPITGGTESVSFQLTLNQLQDDVPVPGNSSCSGSFVVGIAPW